MERSPSFKKSGQTFEFLGFFLPAYSIMVRFFLQLIFSSMSPWFSQDWCQWGVEKWSLGPIYYPFPSEKPNEGENPSPIYIGQVTYVQSGAPLRG
jgi:hypothetical protein